MPKLKVELVQRRHERSSLKYNLETALRVIRGSTADLVVFPEMYLTGYTLGDEVFGMALSNEAPELDELRLVSAQCNKHIIIGLPLRSEQVKGQIHNSASVIFPDGGVVHYNKMHLVSFGPFEEHLFFTPGRDPLIVDVNGWRIGLLICYDLFFPELSRYYALKGCDAIVCISASPSMTRPFFEALLTARAIENTVYILYSNMVGMDARMDFWGGGAVIGPRGDALAKGSYYNEGSITGMLDEELLMFARRNRPTIRDARPHLFRELARLDDIDGPS